MLRDMSRGELNETLVYILVCVSVCARAFACVHIHVLVHVLMCVEKINDSAIQISVCVCTYAGHR